METPGESLKSPVTRTSHRKFLNAYDDVDNYSFLKLLQTTQKLTLYA